MKPAAPKISVLISAYNAESYIEEAVNSVLAQSLDDFELLVMDDGSRDGTYDRLRAITHPRIAVFRQENAGKSVALNALIDKATGRYLTILDADDACDRDRLKVLAGLLDNNPHLGLVQSGYALILDQGICAPRRTRYDEIHCKRRIGSFQMPALDPTMMVRMELAKRFKFDEELRIGQGLDFILKVGEVSDIRVSPEPLYHYRFHFNSITKTKAAEKAQYLLKTINKARARRGLAALAMSDYLRSNPHQAGDKLNNLSGHFVDSAYWSVVDGRRSESRKTALIALKWFFRSGDFKFLKPWVYALFPLVVTARLRQGVQTGHSDEIIHSDCQLQHQANDAGVPGVGLSGNQSRFHRGHSDRQ
ncbi:MAG: glycosyltransferase family 2 protein [Pseudomonadota bacterium]